MVVAPFADHTTRSVPIGSEPPLLFILSPNGSVVPLSMPRYRLENAPAVPEHVQVVPPASFSFPATPPVQPQPPPGELVGPPVMTIAAAAGDAPMSTPSTASVARRATADPWRRRRTGVAVPSTARVCAVEISPCG
jgi:hypothetical protein